jgi:hypothetical protein
VPSVVLRHPVGARLTGSGILGVINMFETKTLSSFFFTFGRFFRPMGPARGQLFPGLEALGAEDDKHLGSARQDPGAEISR